MRHGIEFSRVPGSMHQICMHVVQDTRARYQMAVVVVVVGVEHSGDASVNINRMVSPYQLDKLDNGVALTRLSQACSYIAMVEQRVSLIIRSGWK